MSSLIFNNQSMLMTALKVDICQDWKSTIEPGSMWNLCMSLRHSSSKFFSDRLNSTNQMCGVLSQAAKSEFEISGLLLDCFHS